MIWTLEHAKERIDEIYREYGEDALIYIDYDTPATIRDGLKNRGIDMDNVGWDDDEVVQKFYQQMEPLVESDYSDALDALAAEAKGEPYWPDKEMSYSFDDAMCHALHQVLNSLTEDVKRGCEEAKEQEEN